jgi:(p)ppGpp synthase/HD superfamily hydrolase
VILCRAGCPDEVVIAGMLHDTIEDTTATLEEIRREFGDRVASMVEACSEPDRSLSWEERKRHTLEFLTSAPPEVRFVALADKLDNVRAISTDYRDNGERLWKRFNRGKEDQRWYYEGLVEALRDEGGNQAYRELHSQFAQEVRDVFGDT